MKKYVVKIFIIIILILSIIGLKNEVYADVEEGNWGLSNENQWTLVNMFYKAQSSEDIFKDSTVIPQMGNQSILDVINKYGYPYGSSSEQSFCSFDEYRELYKSDEEYMALDDSEKQLFPLTDPLIIHSTIKISNIISNAGGDYYEVNIGENCSSDRYSYDGSTEFFQNDGLGRMVDTSYFLTLEDLQNKLALKKDIKPNWDTSWDVVLIARVPSAGDISAYMNAEGNFYQIYVEAVCREDELEELKKVYELSQRTPICIYDQGQDTALEKAAESFMSWNAEPVKNIIQLFLDLVKTVLGDVPQMLANLIQTGLEDSGISNLKIDFSPDELNGRDNDNVTNPNAYLKFKKNEQGKSEGQRLLTIDAYVPFDTKVKIEEKERKKLEQDNNYGFKEETKIPLISVDLYTLATNKVEMTDANFLDMSKKTNSTWNFIRDFFASLVHALMYLTMGILLLAIIWCGILIVKDSFDSKSALKSAQHKEMIVKLGKALVMLVTTLIFEAICIYGSASFYDQINGFDGGKYEGPIRVYVTGAKYSFSTTPTGYVRYMADISNILLNTLKAKFVGTYIVLAWSNLLFLVVMMIRMMLMMVLAVVGYVIVILYIVKKDETPMSKYKSWLKMYVGLSVIQILLAAVFAIMMKTIFV